MVLDSEKVYLQIKLHLCTIVGNCIGLKDIPVKDKKRENRTNCSVFSFVGWIDGFQMSFKCTNNCSFSEMTQVRFIFTQAFYSSYAWLFMGISEHN